MVGPILASFDRVELERLEEIVDNTGALYSMGKISHDAAVSLIRMQTDFHLYFSMMGRNTNFRFADHSSVWKNPNRLRYIKRLFGPEGDDVLQSILDDKPIFQNMTHNQLANFPLLYDAFGSDLRMVEVVRHPVELIASWMRRNWGTRLSEDPRALVICFRFSGKDLPFFASGWEETYLTASPIGRVIRMIASLWDRNMESFASLSVSQKRQIFILPFTRFVQEPDTYLEALAGFLGSKTTKHTKSALKRQRCPREYDIDHEKLQSAIEKDATEEERCIVDRLILEYNSLLEQLPI